jgi:hypothetical protein
MLSFQSFAARQRDARAPIVHAKSMEALKQCKTLVVVERETHESIRNHVLTGTAEVGGPFTFVTRPDGVLELRSAAAKGAASQNSTAEYAQITIPRGVVEFHTHPATCSADACAVALPSAKDLINIMVGFRDGVQGHMVYSQDGVYLVRLGDALARLACADDPVGCCRLQRHLCEINERMEGLHARFIKELEGASSEGRAYAAHRARWMEAARALGFDVDLLPLDREPQLEIRAPCAYSANIGQQVTPIVTIDTRALRDASTKCSAADSCAWIQDALKTSAA